MTDVCLGASAAASAAAPRAPTSQKLRLRRSSEALATQRPRKASPRSCFDAGPSPLAGGTQSGASASAIKATPSHRRLLNSRLSDRSEPLCEYEPSPFRRGRSASARNAAPSKPMEALLRFKPVTRALNRHAPSSPGARVGVSASASLCLIEGVDRRGALGNEVAPALREDTKPAAPAEGGSSLPEERFDPARAFPAPFDPARAFPAQARSPPTDCVRAGTPRMLAHSRRSSCMAAESSDSRDIRRVVVRGALNSRGASAAASAAAAAAGRRNSAAAAAPLARRSLSSASACSASRARATAARSGSAAAAAESSCREFIRERVRIAAGAPAVFAESLPDSENAPPSVRGLRVVVSPSFATPSRFRVTASSNLARLATFCVSPGETRNVSDPPIGGSPAASTPEAPFRFSKPPSLVFSFPKNAPPDTEPPRESVLPSSSSSLRRLGGSPCCRTHSE